MCAILSRMLSYSDFKGIQKLLNALAEKADISQVEERLSHLEKSLHTIIVSIDGFLLGA